MIAQKETGIVMYTDGGAVPNPGDAGWGIHGYVYSSLPQDDLKKSTVIDHCATETGYIMKVKKEKQVLVEPVLYIDAFSPMAGSCTNNQAELSAILNAYQIAMQAYDAAFPEATIKNLLIIADSKYSLDAITQWIPNWAKNNWIKRTGEPVKNVELMQQLFQGQKDLIAAGFSVSYAHVNSHIGIMGNEQADFLATIGTRVSLNVNQENGKIEAVRKVTISPTKGYWKTEAIKNPYLDKKRIFFNTHKSLIVPGVYYQGDSGGSDAIFGVRIPDAGYSVVKITSGEEAPIEMVKEVACECADGLVSIAMIQMDQLYNKKIYTDIQTYGKSCLIPKKLTAYTGQQLSNVTYMGKINLSVETNPTALSMRCLDAFTVLEELLDMYTSPTDETHKKLPGFSVHDKTEFFYDLAPSLNRNEIGGVAWTLKKEFDGSKVNYNMDHSIVVNDAEVKLRLPVVLGLDILPRNNLKKIETDHPKVYLITWLEGVSSIRYAFIIESDTTMGIWSNYFADRVFIP